MFRKISIIMKFELLKHLRRKRFYSALILTAAVIILFTYIYNTFDLPGEFGVSDSPELFAGFTIGVGSYIPVLFAIFFSGDALSSEFEQKTGYHLFSNPTSRESIVIGKFLSCLLATASVIVLAYGMTTGILMGLYGEVPIGMMESLGLALLYGASLVGVSFLFSSIFKGVVGSLVAPFLLFFFVFEMISSVLIQTGHRPWYMVNFAGRSLSMPFSALGKAFAGGNSAGTPLDPSAASLVLLAYCLIPLFISILVTKNKQIT
ncbi:hypothetical protein AKJ57_00635 [candidate division MSBL1 archaeon SCGC-AAA259A05]|uniref:ABC transporter permease n=1 Tax=candidate division MSBL1 archaeon SCGC-AAA259A05 TaxID=1698259 RepID=A0A133UBU5_9EURY|nr:hypothetical protein AKJ57_00635 [candidate division MSBL1 archaeon SCGC-AAA259A05]